MNENQRLRFHQGKMFDAYNYFGCIFTEKDGVKGATFRVWADKAKAVSVVGDFNNWDNQKHFMQRISESGIYEIFIEGIKEYDGYKYCIRTSEDYVLYKSDPFAAHSETKGETNSKAIDIKNFKWKDDKWLKKRESSDIYSQPINIYEVHIGSWRKHLDGNYFTYKTFANDIVPYMKETGYTHLELMGVAEYPFDGSWGYQVTGYFAPTSRYGTPEDFQYLINYCHENGISVIVDWVPGHFPKDAHGLYEFDGHPSYESANPKRNEHKEWGTRIFDFGKPEVMSFLISNAMFWLDVYHIDGLRVDAVASMLYLDYDKRHGEWEANKFGGNQNLEAIAFLRALNTEVFSKYKSIMMVAEESTSWPLVTKPVSDGGLGFNFKWNMGWMNDMLRYAKTDPYFRHSSHIALTFSLMYAFSENFILPISHDEVVHGKRSLLDKMPGSYESKFANLRAFSGYQMTHPGKKLNFMGNEFGQFSEWDYKKELDWNLFEYDKHKQIYIYIKALNNFYINHPQLFEVDYSWEGFEWLVVDDNKNSVIIFKRTDKKGNSIICAVNFSPIRYDNYRFGVMGEGKLKEIFTSSKKEFGAIEDFSNDVVEIRKEPSHGKEDSAVITVMPMGIQIFEYLPLKKTKSEKDKTTEPVKAKVTEPKKAVSKNAVKGNAESPVKKSASTKSAKTSKH